MGQCCFTANVSSHHCQGESDEKWLLIRAYWRKQDEHNGHFNSLLSLAADFQCPFHVLCSPSPATLPYYFFFTFCCPSVAADLLLLLALSKQRHRADSMVDRILLMTICSLAFFLLKETVLLQRSQSAPFDWGRFLSSSSVNEWTVNVQKMLLVQKTTVIIIMICSKFAALGWIW